MCDRIRLEARDHTRIDVNVAIHVRRVDGSVESYYVHNAKTNAYLNLLRDHASGAVAVADAQIKYMAWGTDTSEPTASQTDLGAEVDRKQITRLANGAAGIVTITTIITSLEANGVAFGELGLFAGPDAGDTSGSGIMAARVNWSPAHTKTQLESIQADWQLIYS